MAEKDVNITYDTLFELLGREKKREDLQPMQESFFLDVVSYLREKEAILKKSDDDNLFLAEEKDKTKTQLDNVRKIIKELYEKRERKIMEMATFKSRTNSSIINTTNLLKEEKILFESLVEDLNRSRTGVLMKIISANEPFLDIKKSTVDQANTENKNIDSKTDMQEIEKPKLDTSLMVRFISYVPKFVGKELEIYGPFEPEDIANLSRQIAEILIRKGKAIEIKQN